VRATVGRDCVRRLRILQLRIHRPLGYKSHHVSLFFVLISPNTPSLMWPNSEPVIILRPCNRYCQLAVVGDTTAVNACTTVQTWKCHGAMPVWNAEFTIDVDQRKSHSMGDPLGALAIYPSTRQIRVSLRDGKGSVLGTASIALPLHRMQLPKEANAVPMVPDMVAMERIYKGEAMVVQLQASSRASVMLKLHFETLVHVNDIEREEHQKWSLRKQMMREVLLSRQYRDGLLTITVCGARGLLGADAAGLSDPYVIVKQLARSPIKRRVRKTIHEERSATIQQSIDPEWNFVTHLQFGASTLGLDITVWDWDRSSADDKLGSTFLTVEYLQQFREETEVVHALTTPHTVIGGVTSSRRHGRLRLKLKFTPFSDDFADAAPPLVPDQVEATLRQAKSTVDRSFAKHIRQAKKKSVSKCCSAAPPSDGVRGSKARRKVERNDRLVLSTTARNGSLDPTQRDDFFARVIKTVGETYAVVGTRECTDPLMGKLLQMRMIVLGRREVLPHISAIHILTEATGIGGVIGNKGGIIAKVDYRGTSLCFVGSHLAAHEGRKHCNDRNDDAEEVQRNGRVGDTKIDLGNQFSHVFWAGDLNYRQEMQCWWTSPELYASGAKADSPHAEKLDQVKQLIAKADHAALRENDELRREIAAGRVFAGFWDTLDWERDVGRFGLMPTFKVERGSRYRYTAQRVPSFCDRVLVRSAPGEQACVDLVKFQVKMLGVLYVWYAIICMPVSTNSALSVGCAKLDHIRPQGSGCSVSHFCAA
jgi:hypothetical protein